MKIPMMPKGVEHICCCVRYLKVRRNVKIPMMPKGVEHQIAKQVLRGDVVREDSYDAERR